MSYLSNLVTNFAYRILSGKIFQGEPPSPQQTKSNELATKVEKSLGNNELDSKDIGLVQLATHEEKHSSLSFRALINEQRVTKLANDYLLTP